MGSGSPRRIRMAVAFDRSVAADGSTLAFDRSVALVATVLIVGVLAFSQSACFWVTSKHDGNQLRKDVDRIDKSVKTQEDALGSKVKQLKTVLDEATKLLARNSADLGAEVDGLVQDNARITGLVSEARRHADEIGATATSKRKEFDDRISVLEMRIAELERKMNTSPAKTPGDLYADGKAAFDKGNYDSAERIFKILVVKHPGHNLADNAQFYRGQGKFKQKKYQAALGEFQKLFEKYPKSSFADDALFRAGESAEKLKWCTDARAYLGLLRQKYPKSELVAKSKAKDKQLKKAARNKKKCKS